MLGNFQEKRYHDIEFNVENSRALSNRSNTNTLGSTNKGRKKNRDIFFFVGYMPAVDLRIVVPTRQKSYH